MGDVLPFRKPDPNSACFSLAKDQPWCISRQKCGLCGASCVAVFPLERSIDYGFECHECHEMASVVLYLVDDAGDILIQQDGSLMTLEKLREIVGVK